MIIISNQKHYIIPIFIPHIGCPNMCVFCNQSRITGQQKKVTQQDVIDTVNQHLTTIKNAAIVELAFFGGSFTGVDMEYQMELLEAGKKLINDRKIESIRISTRPDYINKKILITLKQYGVRVIELGVQSMDEEVLRLSKRGHSSEDVETASRLIKDYGFILGHQMMVGLPEDNYEKSVKTAKRLIGLKPEIVRIYPVLVIKDTELQSMYTSGVYKPLQVEEAVKWCKDLVVMFEAHNIKVIRVGLQATDAICEEGCVVAGPFHSSFRELVDSEIYFEMLEYILKKIKPAKNDNIFIYVNTRDISKIVGNKKTNISRLNSEFQIEKISIIPVNTVEQNTVVVKINEKDIILSKSFFIKNYKKGGILWKVENN